MADPLFKRYDLRATLDAEEKTMVDEISSLNEDRVLNTSPQDLCDYFVNKFKIEPIELEETQIQVDYGDKQIDVRNRFEYAVFDESRPVYVSGTRVTFYIPFRGDRQLFHCKPSAFMPTLPYATFNDDEVRYTYDLTTLDMPRVQSGFEKDLDTLKQYIGSIERDVQSFNSTIGAKASECIASRREKILQDRKLVESLGFPLRRREGVPMTYAAPEVKRKIAPRVKGGAMKDNRGGEKLYHLAPLFSINVRANC